MTAMDEGGLYTHTIAYPETHDQIRLGLLFGNAIADPTVIYRRELLQIRSPLYASTYEGAEDYDLWTHLINVTGAYNVQVPLVKYRCHRKQYSQMYTASQARATEEISRRSLKAFAPDVGIATHGHRALSFMYSQYLSAFRECKLDAWPRAICNAQQFVRAKRHALPDGAEELVKHAIQILPKLGWRYIQTHGSYDEALQRLAEEEAKPRSSGQLFG